MSTLCLYKKKGLPFDLINLHEFLLEDIVVYFERGKFITRRVKKARKMINQALRFVKKKNTYPSNKTNVALQLIEELLEEINYTHHVLKKASAEMERMISQIKEERIMNVSSLINTARVHFREKEFEKGVELFEEAKKELGKKYLINTRKNYLNGLDSEIKKIKYEIEKKQK